jgi:hypothetical protein
MMMQKAAADDDLASFSKMQPVFNKLLTFIEARESAAMKSYKKLYGENPKEWGIAENKNGEENSEGKKQANETLNKMKQKYGLE